MPSEAERDAKLITEIGRRGISRRTMLETTAKMSLAAFLAGCSPQSSPQGAPTSGAGPKIDMLSVATSQLGSQQPDSVLSTGGASRPNQWGMYGAIQYRDYDYSLKPDMATAFTLSDDLRTTTFTLRNGVKHHDGSPVTARDYETMVTRLMTDQALATVKPSWSPFLSRFENLKVIDDQHFSITLKIPWWALTAEGSMPAPVPTDAFNKIGSAEFLKHPIGQGAFKFVSQVINQEMVYERFADFWDQSRMPNFQTLKMLQIGDPSTRMAALTNGSVDAITDLTVDIAQQLQASAGSGIKVIQNDTCSQVLIFIKRDHPDTPPEMNDARVRQALLYAIDRESIVKALYKVGEVPALPLPKEMPGFDSSLKPLPYDPDKAKALLRDANATNMKPFTVTLKDVDVLAPNVQQLMQAIIGYWKAVGIDASARPVDQPTFVGGAQSQKLPLFLAGVPPVFDIGEFGAGYLSPGATNTPANDDQKLIDMFAQIDRTSDPAERAKLAGPFTRYLNDTQYLLALVQMPSFFAIGPKIDQWTMRRGNGYAGPWWGIHGK